jgi:hypothetical protein
VGEDVDVGAYILCFLGRNQSNNRSPPQVILLSFSNSFILIAQCPCYRRTCAIGIETHSSHANDELGCRFVPVVLLNFHPSVFKLDSSTDASTASTRSKVPLHNVGINKVPTLAHWFGLVWFGLVYVDTFNQVRGYCGAPACL